MPFSPKSLEEKPYNRCLNCEHIGENCDGPNFLAMEMPRLCEWCRNRKEYLHVIDPKWTNAYIADQSGLSKISVDRFLSGNVDDIKTSTIARIIKVLVNGSWGQYPCAMTGQNESEQCKQLRAALDKANAEHKEELAAVRADDQRKIDFLKEQITERTTSIRRKDRFITILSILLGACILVIITALILDLIDPTRGFFWLA